MVVYTIYFLIHRKSKKRRGASSTIHTKTAQNDAETKSTTESEMEVNGQDQVTGFERGLEAEKILGATEVDNEIHFLVKWYVKIIWNCACICC